MASTNFIFYTGIGSGTGEHKRKYYTEDDFRKLILNNYNEFRERPPFDPFHSNIEYIMDWAGASWVSVRVNRL